MALKQGSNLVLCAILPPILKYLDLQDILTKLLPLCKSANEVVRGDNYTLYKKFLQLFCINYERKRFDDLPAEVDMINLISENVKRVRELQEKRKQNEKIIEDQIIAEQTADLVRDPVLEVAVFETDGGADDKIWYCIFNELLSSPNKSYISNIKVEEENKEPSVPLVSPHVHLQGYAG